MDGSALEVSLPARLQESFIGSLPIPSGTDQQLRLALHEALARPGNFIRAQLAYAVGRSFGSTDEMAMQLAIALEYFHTASLIFDDLPSMDDAMHRRGGECIHRLFGEGTAILAGLTLINRAYCLLWQCIARSHAGVGSEAARYTERYLGLEGLLNGQSLDIGYAGLPLDQRRPQQVARGKTVGLLRLALVLPLMMNGADSRVIRLTNHVAVFWGLAYQVIDDFKDVLQSPESVGKTTARDKALDRPNLVLSRGVPGAVRTLRRLAHCADSAVDQLIRIDGRMQCLMQGKVRLDRETERILQTACEVTA